MKILIYAHHAKVAGAHMRLGPGAEIPAPPFPPLSALLVGVVICREIEWYSDMSWTCYKNDEVDSVYSWNDWKGVELSINEMNH